MPPTAASSLRVPLETLCDVFVHLPFADRVQTSHVCRTWRDASLAYPGALWSHIISNGSRAGVLAQLLERSRGLPVRVEVLLTDASLGDALPAIQKHLQHIRTLRLHSFNIGEGEISQQNIPLVYGALAYPAPQLTSLDIRLPIADLANGYDIPTNIFAGQAPQLRQATWLETRLEPRGYGYPALRGLTRYDIKTTYLSAVHISAILTWLPALTFLKIVTFAYDLPQVPPSSPHRLEELYIELRSAFPQQSVVSLLEYFGYVHVRRVTISPFVDWLERFSSSPRTIPHTLKIEAGPQGQDHWCIIDDSGYTSQCLDPPTYLILRSPFASRVFERLETLNIMVIHLRTCCRVAPLPRLSRLVVRATDNGQSIRRLGSPSSQIKRLVCPQLRLLELRGRELTWTMLILSAEDVDRFMLTTLAFDTVKPPRVILRHAALSSPIPTNSEFGSGQVTRLLW